MYAIQQKVWKDEIWIKHVTCEGSRSHVYSWSDNGSQCKEKNCIMNAPNDIVTRATMEGKEIHIFIKTVYLDGYSTVPKTKTYFQSV